MKREPGPIHLAILLTTFEALKEHEWSAPKAADYLCISERTVKTYRKQMKELGWEVGKYSAKGKKRRQYKVAYR
jgi:hypothetical protein